DDLVLEVLDSQPPERREFLLRTSVLERMCGPLCDAVADADCSAEALAELECANLFVVALDSRREWYRYHHLFQDLLRRELELTSGELAPELQRRAARWHEAHDSMGDAIEYAVAARDVGLAAELITGH